MWREKKDIKFKLLKMTKVHMLSNDTSVINRHGYFLLSFFFFGEDMPVLVHASNKSVIISSLAKIWFTT